ncbi:T3SS effector HopA1 family protein [Demequina iriomotensis]|uniref:T3SS effector HopA1 family protein n=1 Tax=Demequina iriomotensis TaxID=1536641 RepID=UPI0007812488|nr:T3SS effector HopA1 family protein [Demequina iriomotensis]
MTADAAAPAAGIEAWAGPEDLEALAGIVAEAPGEALERELYHRWYLQMRPAVAGAGAPGVAPLAVDPARALWAAHAGAALFEDGWVARAVSSAGRVEAVRGDERRVAGPGEHVVRGRPGRRPRPGDALALASTVASVEDGWWVGRSGLGFSPDVPFTRVYVHVRQDSAAAGVAVLTQALVCRVPFAVKVSMVLGEADRPDGLVLYVARRDFHASLRAPLAAAFGRLGSLGLVEASVPRMTARLAPGVGAADGPPDGGSFGLERCGVVAAAARSLAPGSREPGALADAVAAAFAAAGLDPARPYLASPDDHDYLDAR